MVRTDMAEYTLAPELEELQGVAMSSQTLTGNATANRIIGGFFDDQIDGRAGADRMQGFHGDDTYYVDNASDEVIEDNPLAGSADTVVTTLNAYLLGDNVEHLRFNGRGGFDGTGNTLANMITGGAWEDMLSGGDGADVLRGAGGADRLTGGAGADLFCIDASAVTRRTADVITDFSVHDDLIDLSEIDANLGAAGRQAFGFIGSAAFSGVAGEMRIGAGKVLWVEGDRNGDARADFFLQVQGAESLAADDFVS